MTTKLPKRDVVVVGLGGAGGIAVVPLTDAGLAQGSATRTVKLISIAFLRNDISKSSRILHN